MYIKGFKNLKTKQDQDDDKLKHEQDVEWRKTMNLQPYYFSKKYIEIQKSAFIFNK